MGYSPGRGGGGGGGAGAGGGAAFDVGAGGESFANTPRVLNFGSPHNSPMKRPASKNTESESHRAIKSMHSKMSANDHLNRKAKRAIPTAPERVLDAPGLLNDYYLNLVDWNCKNILAVALDKTVYLWNAATREIQELLSLDGANYVSSLSYVHENGNLLAIGTSDHKVQIWDIAAIAKVREMRGHSARVGSLAWRGPLLTSGSKDTTIINHDHRVSRHIVSTYKSHRQEVCGLAWNSDGLTLASGGNDNLLALWDVRRQNSGESHYDEPTHSCKDHLAAVKALVRALGAVSLIYLFSKLVFFADCCHVLLSKTGLVSTSAQCARDRWRNSGPYHQNLECCERKVPELCQHWKSSLLPDLEQKRERTSVVSWIQ